jgi:DNA-binding NarL/FixJ family response regulator
MLRLLIVDDHPMLRKGLAGILRESYDDIDIGESATGEDALDRIREKPWDIVVLDITLPGMSGLAVLPAAKGLRPEMPIIMLSMHSGRLYVNRSLNLGASGYLTKESAPDELVAAVRSVLTGKSYLSQSIRDTLDPLE